MQCANEPSIFYYSLCVHLGMTIILYQDVVRIDVDKD